MKWIADGAIQNYRQVNGYIPSRGVFFHDSAVQGRFQLVVDLETGLAMVLTGSVLIDDECRGGVGDEFECGNFLLIMMREIFKQHGVFQRGTSMGVPGAIL